MDWNRLRVFLEVCRRGSLEAAAETLFVSQSAVSQQIKKLEAEVGEQLFQRSGRKLLPLAPASKLLSVVSEFSEQIERWNTEVNKGKTAPFGPLRLGTPPYFGKHHLMPFLFEFRRKYPGVVSNVQIINHPWVITEKVLAGELDMGIVDYSDTMSEQYPISITPLAKEKLTIIGKPELIPQGNFTYEVALAQTYISYVPDALGVRMWFKYQWKKLPAKLNVSFSCEDVETVAEAVKQGLGLGLLPTHVVHKELSKGSLVAVRTPRGPRINPIGIAQAPGRSPSVTSEFFLEQLCQRCAKTFE